MKVGFFKSSVVNAGAPSASPPMKSPIVVNDEDAVRVQFMFARWRLFNCEKKVGNTALSSIDGAATLQPTAAVEVLLAALKTILISFAP